MIFLQSYVITLGGRLLETGNKRIGRISGVKSGRGRLRNLPSGRLGENFWKSISLTNKKVISKVVTYEKDGTGTFLLNKMRVYFQGMRVAAFTLAWQNTAPWCFPNFCLGLCQSQTWEQRTKFVSYFKMPKLNISPKSVMFCSYEQNMVWSG